jgi:hypothetical protein
MDSKKQRPVVWLKHRMQRRDHSQLMRVLVGVAYSHSSENKFEMVDLDSSTKFIFKKNDQGNYTVTKHLLRSTPDNFSDIVLLNIKRSSHMVYLVSNKSNLIEKLTKASDLKIICIYVTASRKTFRGLKGDNITRCLVHLRKQNLDEKPLTDLEIEWQDH